jgi:hypothetical protein
MLGENRLFSCHFTVGDHPQTEQGADDISNKNGGPFGGPPLVKDDERRRITS